MSYLPEHPTTWEKLRREGASPPAWFVTSEEHKERRAWFDALADRLEMEGGWPLTLEERVARLERIDLSPNESFTDRLKRCMWLKAQLSQIAQRLGELESERALPRNWVRAPELEQEDETMEGREAAPFLGDPDRGAGGGTGGASMPSTMDDTDPRPAGRLEATLDNIRRLVDVAGETNERLGRVADRVLDCEPEDDGPDVKSEPREDPDGMLSRVTCALESLDRELTGIRNQAMRLEEL